MRSEFREKFLKDLGRISNPKIKKSILHTVLEVEQADSIMQIRNLKKLQGDKHAYRIRVGEYRVGIYIAGDTVTFTRCLHRKDIYKYFP